MPNFLKEGSNTANMQGSEFYGYGTAPTQYASPTKHTGEDVTHPGPGKEGDEGYHKAHGSLKPAFTAEEIKEAGEEEEAGEEFKP